MEAKIEKISELSKLLSVKTRMSDDLFHLFGKFGIGHLLSRLSLEKQEGVSVSELILSLCLFRIVGESIHRICKHFHCVTYVTLPGLAQSACARLQYFTHLTIVILDSAAAVLTNSYHGQTICCS